MSNNKDLKTDKKRSKTPKNHSQSPKPNVPNSAAETQKSRKNKPIEKVKKFGEKSSETAKQLYKTKIEQIKEKKQKEKEATTPIDMKNKDIEALPPSPKPHINCRTSNENEPKFYENSRNKNSESAKIQRPLILDNNVAWSIQYPDYKPVEFTSEKVLNGNKYDLADVKEIKNWNEVDEKIDRRSYHGKYEFDAKTHRPLNPIGRTGLSGRGHLGRWGPNHAADPIVTRWKTDENAALVKENDKPVLQFVAIQRQDTQEWAIPGGMVDPNEKVTDTLQRKFTEEAVNSSPEANSQIKELFSSKNGKMIYQGYVDDPRNTDNAWMETAAYNFHADSSLFDKIKLVAGDDAKGVQWMDIDQNLNLYASHKEFIKKVVDQHGAHW